MSLLVTFRRKRWAWFGDTYEQIQEGSWKDLLEAIRDSSCHCWVLMPTREPAWHGFLLQLEDDLERQPQEWAVIMPLRRDQLRMTERFGPARIWVVPPTIFGSKVRATRRERRRMAQLRSKLVFLLPLDDQELLHQGALSQLIHSTTSLLVDCHLIPHRPWSDSPSSDWSRLDQLPSEIAIAELVKTLKRDSVQLLVLVCPHQGHCHLWLELVVLTAILTSEFQVQWVILTKGGADEQKESVLRLVDPLLCLVDPLL